MADDTIGDVWRPRSKSDNDDASVDTLDSASDEAQTPDTGTVMTDGAPTGLPADVSPTDLPADEEPEAADDAPAPEPTAEEWVLSDDAPPTVAVDDEPAHCEARQDETAGDEARQDETAGGEAPQGHSADEESAPASARSFPGGLSLNLPVPGRIRVGSVRGAAAKAGHLLMLSPASVRLPVWLAAVVAAAWAAAVGLLGATILAALSGVADPQPSLRTTIWLVAHHAPVSTEAGTVSLLPLGLLILTVLPLRRAGRFVAAQCAPAARTVQRVSTVGAVAVACYAGLAGMIAATDRTLPAVDIWSAVFWAVLVAVFAGGWGAVRQERGHLPRPPFVVAVAVTVMVPLGIAVLLTLASVLLAFGDIRTAQEQIAQPGMEQVGITLLQLAYLPNLVVWAAAFVMGTGITLGIDRGLSPFGADEAVLPDLPILAAIPADAPNWTAILPITVALGGVLGAVVFARLLPERRLRRRITRAIAMAVTSGVFWWILMTLAGGSLGEGRLDAIGPAPGSAFVAMLLTSAGTLLWALLPTLASDARPVAVDLRDRVSTAASAAKDVTNARLPTGKR